MQPSSFLRSYVHFASMNCRHGKACAYACVRVCECASVCVRVYVCTYACVYVCVCVCWCVRARVMYGCVHAYDRSCEPLYVPTQLKSSNSHCHTPQEEELV